MLLKLYIKNYALIDELSLDFNKGFSVITGETGSGKSILLGAMGLILGSRSDSNVLHDDSQKCIVEGEFDIEDYNLKVIFEKEDLDYSPRSIFRREILVSGRSRAFINDTPVSLVLLKKIGSQLVDIHSQHDIIMLKNNSIQLEALDAFAQNDGLKKNYLSCFLLWEKLKKEFDSLKKNIIQSNLDKDYIEFQLQELRDSNIQEGEKEKLESEQKIVESAEDIKFTLTEVNEILSSEQNGVLQNARLIENAMLKIADKSDDFRELSDRIKSVRLELTDIQNSLEQGEMDLDVDPNSLMKIQQRLDVLYRLESKHRVNSITELIEVQEKLSDSIIEADRLEVKLKSIEKERDEVEVKLSLLGAKLTESRKSKIVSFQKKIKQLLGNLAMDKSQVKVQIEKKESFGRLGIDQVNFLFNANSGGKLQDLSKVASGGELSRVMLAIKSILADRSGLPVLIFDEIDTGISGKVSSMVAKMMVDISQARQVFSITHQAQVASLGDSHYKVSKLEVNKKTKTKVQLLDSDSRIKEIAEMISGQTVTEHSLANATELLSQDAG